MYSCQCHQIGGPFIAEDPDCPAHGLEAQREARRREEVIDELDAALDSEEPERIEAKARDALYYLRSL
jgi:hypothetical protein